MKFKHSMVLVFVLALGLTSVSAAAKDKKGEGLKTEKDKLSYTLGLDISRSLLPLKNEVEFGKVIMGITHGFEEKEPLVSEEEARDIMRAFSIKMRQKMIEEMKAVGDKNLIEGESFLKENKEKEGVVTTESGLQYMVIKEGDGPKPADTDTVNVHYRGTTIDGEEFDSSYSRGEPATFPVTGVIPGWTEALQLMNVGSQYKLFVPSELAYGPRGAGGAIGPNAVLIFEVELIGIE